MKNKKKHQKDGKSRDHRQNRSQTEKRIHQHQTQDQFQMAERMGKCYKLDTMGIPPVPSPHRPNSTPNMLEMSTQTKTHIQALKTQIYLPRVQHELQHGKGIPPLPTLNTRGTIPTCEARTSDRMSNMTETALRTEDQPQWKISTHRCQTLRFQGKGKMPTSFGTPPMPNAHRETHSLVLR